MELKTKVIIYYSILFIIGFTIIGITSATNIQCYQEMANSSYYNDGNCILNYTGVYADKPNYLYINYTKPRGRIINATSALVSNGFGWTNYPINSSCYNFPKISLRYFSNGTDNAGFQYTQTRGECYNGTGWTIFYDFIYNTGTLYSGTNVSVSKTYDGDTNTGAIYVGSNWLYDSMHFSPFYYNRINEEGIIWNINGTLKVTYNNSITGATISPTCTVQYGSLDANGNYEADGTHGIDSITCSLTGYETKTQSFNVQDGNFEVLMTTPNVYIWFWKNGIRTNASGYISDSIGFSETFYGNNISKVQSIFNDDKVIIRWVNGTVGLLNISWENKSQYYEYDNSEETTINENVSVFERTNYNLYIQTLDISNNVIRNAKIRLYGILPSTTAGTRVNSSLYGQRYTDENGITNFPLDAKGEYYAIISANGYETKTIPLTIDNFWNPDRTSTMSIHLKQSGYTTKSNVYLSGIYKTIFGTNTVWESSFDDVTKDYFLFVYDDERRTIKYNTTYKTETTTKTVNSANTAIISLANGINFNNNQSLNSSFNLFIYADDELVYTIPFNFDNRTGTTIIDVDEIGLKNSKYFKFAIFMILIGISAGIGMFFQAENIGLHTFMIGSIMIAFIINGFAILLWISSFYYGGTMIKKVFSE